MVEGQDDKWTIINLLKRHGYDWGDGSLVHPYVHDADGVDELLKKEVLSVALTRYERLGIVIDADFPPVDRWEQARKVLTELGFTLPTTPTSNGTILQGKRPDWRVGIWLMPDNSLPGRLEEFIEKLIPEGHVLWPHAQQSTTRAMELGAQLRSLDHNKAAIHTWLAWQKDPGLPFGNALARSLLNHDSPEAKLFIDWFGRCFD
jgi:hypothetical protein